MSFEPRTGRRRRRSTSWSDINLEVRGRRVRLHRGPLGLRQIDAAEHRRRLPRRRLAGEVLVDGEPVHGPDPRRIFIFQENGVFPWLTVEDNIGFGVKRSNRGGAGAS